MISQFKKVEITNNIFRQNGPVYFVHDFDRDAYVRGGHTIAYVISNDGQTIYYAISKCNKLDQYSKRVGRELAIEHANQGKIQELKYSDCCNWLYAVSPMKLSCIRRLNFHDISKKIINKMMLWSAIKLLGRHFYFYDIWTEMVLEKPENMILPCVICPNFPKADPETDFVACNGCDIQDLMIDAKFAEEDDDEYDWE